MYIHIYIYIYICNYTYVRLYVYAYMYLYNANNHVSLRAVQVFTKGILQRANKTRIFLQLG